jgi:hypothetical protein
MSESHVLFIDNGQSYSDFRRTIICVADSFDYAEELEDRIASWIVRYKKYEMENEETFSRFSTSDILNYLSKNPFPVEVKFDDIESTLWYPCSMKVGYLTVPRLTE